MNEQEQISQLSALFDNELPPEQSAMVIRRALKDPALRASWGRYALIGACLRNEPVHADSRQPDVAERVRARLAAEAEHSPTAAQAAASADSGRGRYAILGRGALAGAIAASVAVISLVVVRSMSPAVTPAVQLAQAVAPASVSSELQPAAAVGPAENPVLVAARDALPPSYTTPVDNSPAQRLNGPLVNYVVAHSEVAASAVRFSPLSTVMSSDYDITQGAVEMTEAEIGAHR